MRIYKLFVKGWPHCEDFLFLLSAHCGRTSRPMMLPSNIFQHTLFKKKRKILVFYDQSCQKRWDRMSNCPPSPQSQKSLMPLPKDVRLTVAIKDWAVWGILCILRPGTTMRRLRRAKWQAASQFMLEVSAVKPSHFCRSQQSFAPNASIRTFVASMEIHTFRRSPICKRWLSSPLQRPKISLCFTLVNSSKLIKADRQNTMPFSSGTIKIENPLGLAKLWCCHAFCTNVEGLIHSFARYSIGRKMSWILQNVILFRRCNGAAEVLCSKG